MTQAPPAGEPRFLFPNFAARSGLRACIGKLGRRNPGRRSRFCRPARRDPRRPNRLSNILPIFLFISCKFAFCTLYRACQRPKCACRGRSAIRPAILCGALCAIGLDGRTPSGSTFRFRRATLPPILAPILAPILPPILAPILAPILPGGAAPGVDRRSRPAGRLEKFLSKLFLRTPKRRLPNNSNGLRSPGAKKRIVLNVHSKSGRFPASGPSGTPLRRGIPWGRGQGEGYHGEGPAAAHFGSA